MINCLMIYVFRFNLLQNHCKNNEHYCEIPYLRPRNPRAVAPQRHAHPPRPCPRPQHPRQTLPRRHPRHLPLPIRPPHPQRQSHPHRLRPRMRPRLGRKLLHPQPHPLSRRPNRKLLHGQQTGSRLPPLTRRQTRNNRNHHRRHRMVCAHLGIRLVPVNDYLLVYHSYKVNQVLGNIIAVKA